METESRNNKPKISIVMPSLNVRPYIRQCLDSVVGQSLQEIEILCVDAGSIDGTLEILREYENNDIRIKVILSERKSYGYQMNLGIAAAAGEYIGIVETDDWIEPNMFEVLYSAAKAQNADIVKANYYWYYTKDEERNERFQNLAKCPYDTVFSPEKNIHFFEATPAIWSGIYRKEMLTQWGIRFNETPGASYQDASFHFMVSAATNRVLCLRDCFLHYRKDNENSSVNNAGKVYCICDEMHYFERFLEEHPGKKERLYEDYMALKYEKYRWNYERIAPQFQWSFLNTIRSEFSLHRAESALSKEKFTDKAWDNVSRIIDSPVKYYKETCKKYYCRPTGTELPEAEMLVRSKIEQPAVSIIVPGYNSEKTIRRTLNSLKEQTIPAFEVVCVDDGSEDTTLQIMLAYAEEDSRITVLHQVNEGLASARNAGMRAARGKYVQFLDSDDMLREDAVSLLFQYAEENSVDILYFDGQSVYESKKLEEKFPQYRTLYEYDVEMPSVLSGKEYLIKATEDQKYRVTACLALYRVAFLLQEGIQFMDGIVHEDNAFSFESIIKAERVWHTTEKLYYRYVYGGTTMTSKKTFEHVYGYFRSVQRIVEIMREIPYEEKLDTAFKVRLKSLIYNLKTTYANVDNKSQCRSKFTGFELCILDHYRTTPLNEVKEKLRKIIKPN